MYELSSNLLVVSFFAYFFATLIFSISVTGKKMKGENIQSRKEKWGKIGLYLSIIGFLFQTGYFVTRWIASGFAPVSNMFEYMTFFGMMMVLGYFILFYIYRNYLLGLFSLPVAMIIIAYASVFSREITPLVPALQSYWLQIHVTTAALGEGILAISFIAGMIYLIRVVNQSKTRLQTVMLEIVMYSLLSTIGFAVIVSAFQSIEYETTFQWVDERDVESQLVYKLPAIVGPLDGQLLEESKHEFGPLFETPSWMNGASAPRKFNSFIWALVSGLAIYVVIRLVLRKRIGAFIQPFLKNVNTDLLDEIGYRAVAIGFPIFTLGALIFAAIWAQEAWTRFWGWDPKEVWALITWLFYAAYLHLRLSKGWHGISSAWLSVVGFVVIMLNLVVVNLVIAGLHSYA